MHRSEPWSAGCAVHGTPGCEAAAAPDGKGLLWERPSKMSLIGAEALCGGLWQNAVAHVNVLLAQLPANGMQTVSSSLPEYCSSTQLVALISQYFASNTSSRLARAG